jgi:hypothetical protein
LSRSAARFEIKDARALDKDIEPRHARNAHVLRRFGFRRSMQEMPMKSSFLADCWKARPPH